MASGLSENIFAASRKASAASRSPSASITLARPRFAPMRVTSCWLERLPLRDELISDSPAWLAPPPAVGAAPKISGA